VHRCAMAVGGNHPTSLKAAEDRSAELRFGRADGCEKGGRKLMRFAALLVGNTGFRSIVALLCRHEI